MQIVDRYLRSVKNCLPAAQADDIIKELSENISSQIEDREGELNRPLTEAEIEAILKQHGHPLVVASRYRQEQRSVSFGRQIIGPALFPFYIRVLKFNLGLTSIILIAIFGALFSGGQPVGTFPQVFVYQLLIQFVIVTAIFWAMDKHFTQFPDRWDPRKSYGVRHPAFSISEEGPRIPRVKSASRLVGFFVGLIWFRLMRHSPSLIFGPAASFLQFSPQWNQLYVPITVVILLEMVNAGVTLVRPDWVRFYWLMRIVASVGNLIVASLLITRGNPVIMTLKGTPNAARLAQIVNQTITYCVWISVAILLFHLVKDLYRLISTHPATTQAQST